MSEEMKFIPYELAMKIVGNVIEEEHIQQQDRRILTVYDKNAKEICWFDADEIMAESKEKSKEAAVELILHQIPEWAVDDLLKKMEGEKEKK